MTTIRANTLEKGQKLVIVSGNFSFNAEILGFTDDKSKYGEGGVVFSSHKEMMAQYNVKSLKALEELQDKNEYGYQSYLVVRDLESKDEGAWIYLFKGRWSIGSGAEKVSFRKSEEKIK